MDTVLAGFDVVAQASEVRRHVGFLSANTGVYDRMTAWELVEYFGMLYGFRGEALTGRIADPAMLASRGMERGLTEARNIRVDTIPEQYDHAGEVAFFIRAITCRTSDGLDQNPVPLRVAERPRKSRECKFDDSRASMIGCGPGQFLRQILAWIRLEQPSGFVYIMPLGDHVWLRLCAARQQEVTGFLARHVLDEEAPPPETLG